MNVHLLIKQQLMSKPRWLNGCRQPPDDVATAEEARKCVTTSKPLGL